MAEHIHAESVPVVVSCPVEQVTSYITRNDLEMVLFEDPTKNFYRFDCPACGATHRPALPYELGQIMSHFNVRAVNGSEWPAESLETKSGPPLSTDDVLDLLLTLRDLPTVDEPIVAAPPRQVAGVTDEE